MLRPLVAVKNGNRLFISSTLAWNTAISLRRNKSPLPVFRSDVMSTGWGLLRAERSFVAQNDERVVTDVLQLDGVVFAVAEPTRPSRALFPLRTRAVRLYAEPLQRSETTPPSLMVERCCLVFCCWNPTDDENQRYTSRRCPARYTVTRLLASSTS